MALGNSMSVGKARGKARPVKIKRRKEVVAAKDYNSVVAGTREHRPACGYTGSMSNTFYHNGTSAAPGVGDIVYLTRRARSDNKITAGHYKIIAGKAIYSIEVNSSGVVGSRISC